MANLATFDFDPDVVKGWNSKSNLREVELSKYVPLAKLYAVLKGSDIKKGENRGVEVNIKGHGNNIRLDDVAKIISQTEDDESFRGGIGITEVSVKYVSIEAGALEARVGVVISNFDQIGSSKNKSVINMFYPGKEFLLVYGWQTDTNQDASIFRSTNGSIPTVDLTNFDNGMRRYLYCALHHFEWNFGDQGRIYGVLHFWTPDTVRLSLKRVDKNLDLFSDLTIDNVSTLYEQFKTDVNRIDQNNKTAKVADNHKVLDLLKDLANVRINELSLDPDVFYVVTQLKSVGVLNKKILQSNAASEGPYEMDSQSEKIYLGWLLEAAKYVCNKRDKNSLNKDIYFRYKDFHTTRTKKLTFFYTNENNKMKSVNAQLGFNNVFFIPVDFVDTLNYIKKFKGSFKYFIDELLKKVNDDYDGLISLILKVDHNIYEIDDILEKSSSKDKRLQIVGSDGKTRYRNDDPNTPVVSYGFNNSLVYNVKISSTIPPDIIWGQGLDFDHSEDSYVNMINRIENMTDEQRASNEGYVTLHTEYIEESKEELQKKPKQARISANFENEKMFENSLTPAERKQIAIQTVKKLAHNDKNIMVLMIGDAITSGKINLGVILRNYFNGLTITIHGTAGFQAFKSFLFKGFELLTTKQGIDGLYSIINVNDIVTPKNFQTVLEAGRVNSLPVL